MIVNEIKGNALNAVCPYFTMFPLNFPYTILKHHASLGDWVLDPFCGRGTTNYASRLLGLPSIGVDSSPVAVALSLAKLANTTPEKILVVAQQILEEVREPTHIPAEEFWHWAFHDDTLFTICRLREGLLQDCASDERKALRAILMGALHGPLTKTRPSYLSNQSQRTYAPKPRYAVNFWKEHNLLPPRTDVLEVLEHRAKKYYAQETDIAVGTIIHGDSQDTNVLSQLEQFTPARWIITSPPYYGMRTYIPDQWLRMWFLGGKSTVDYSTDGQVSHASPTHFANALKNVWENVGSISHDCAHMVIRFGGINDRKADPLSIIKQSLDDTKWVINKIESAGFSSEGRRQALHFSNPNKRPLEEYDIWATLHNK